MNKFGSGTDYYIKTIYDLTKPLSLQELKARLKDKPYSHTVKTEVGIEWGYDQKGFYYINNGKKDHNTNIDDKTKEFVLDQLDKTDPKKMGS